MPFLIDDGFGSQRAILMDSGNCKSFDLAMKVTLRKTAPFFSSPFMAPLRRFESGTQSTTSLRTNRFIILPSIVIGTFQKVFRA
jgi:hypothetical protein